MKRSDIYTWWMPSWSSGTPTKVAALCNLTITTPMEPSQKRRTWCVRSKVWSTRWWIWRRRWRHWVKGTRSSFETWRRNITSSGRTRSRRTNCASWGKHMLCWFQWFSLNNCRLLHLLLWIRPRQTHLSLEDSSKQHREMRGEIKPSQT